MDSTICLESAVVSKLIELGCVNKLVVERELNDKVKNSKQITYTTL